MRSGLVAALIVAVGLPLTAEGAALSGYCVAVDTAATRGETEVAAGEELSAGEQIATPLYGRAALHLIVGEESSPVAESAVYLDNDSTVELLADQGNGVWRLRLLRGRLVAKHTGGVPLAAATPSAWARLARGTLVVSVEDGSGTFAGASGTFVLAEGAAEFFDGPLPVGGGVTVAGGTPLTAQPSARAEARALIRVVNAAQLAASARFWVQRAERGDLVPAGIRGQVAQAIDYRTVPPVDQPTTVTPVTTPVFVSGVAVPVTTGRAESLLTSQNPASVVVGARLERTRIVGSPGTATGSGLRFNPEARAPLSLAPGR